MASQKPWSIPDLPSTTPMSYNTSSQLLPAQFYSTTHPAKLAGVLRTAIGPASLAGQLAVRSTRAQHLAPGAEARPPGLTDVGEQCWGDHLLTMCARIGFHGLDHHTPRKGWNGFEALARRLFPP